MAAAKRLHPAFQHNRYLFRRKVFKIFGGAFHVYDNMGNLLLYSKQKAFRLREDFRVYSDESQVEGLLTIKTPQILDVWATYDVQDVASSEVIGAIRRKGFASIVKDTWVFLSNKGQDIGRLTERNMVMALLSRFIGLIPQTYIIVSVDGREVAEIKRHFNPFVLKYSMVITEPQPLIDRRLLISSVILLASIERRQRGFSFGGG